MNNLSTTTQQWKVVIAQIPGYTAGGSGAHTDLNFSINVNANELAIGIYFYTL
jgi:hypothetical protein